MYYIKKIIKGIFSIYLISTISFFLMSLIPGDPALSILGIDAPEEQIELFRQTFGLNKPILVRYIYWLKNALVGDFGTSLKYNLPVKEIVLQSLSVTMLVTVISLLIIFFVSVLLSFYINKVKSKKMQKVWDVILGISISIPSFWLGVICIFTFSVILRLFNLGYDGSFVSLLAPCLIISFTHIGSITMNMKENLYHEKRKDYAKFLYSNGMKMRYLNLYILKNSVITVLSLFGLLTIDLITGIVIVEQIFSIPGIGRLLLTSIYSRDIPLIQALIVYTSIAVIIINLLIDFLYSLLDKRIRMGGKSNE